MRYLYAGIVYVAAMAAVGHWHSALGAAGPWVALLVGVGLPVWFIRDEIGRRQSRHSVK